MKIASPLNSSRKTHYNPYRTIHIKSGAALLLVFFGLMSFSVAAQTGNANTRDLNLEKGIALSGYDAVSYFSQHKAVKGSASNRFSENGVTYYFSSAADLELFKKNPAQYRPAYGGWCAYAMAVKGEKVEVDPETFKIIKGRLYLFYNKYFNNTLTSWNKDETNLLPKADANWNKLTGQ